MSDGRFGLEPPPLKTQLREARQKLALAQTQAKLRRLEEGQKRRVKLREWADGWESLGAYGDILDRLRGDGTWLPLYSTAMDRRHGANWPFWRSWQEHAKLRGAARYCVTTTTTAAGCIRGLTSYVIGTGHGLSATLKDEDRWAETDPNTGPRALAKRVQEILDEFSLVNDWPGLQKELFARDRRDGESFRRLFVPADGIVRLRTVEPEWVIEPPASTVPYEEGSFGIITDPEDIEDIDGYWVTYNGDPVKGEATTPDRMYHNKINVDRIIKRGLTDFCFDTYDSVRSAAKLLANMAEGSAIQAAIAYIVQHESATVSDVTDFVAAGSDYTETNPYNGRTEQVTKFRPGTIAEIDKGQTFAGSPYSQGTSLHTAVHQLVLRAGVAVRWNAPEWLVSGDSSNNNFSSSLVADSMFGRSCVGEQMAYSGKFVNLMWCVLRCYCEAKGGIFAGGRRYEFDEIRQLVEIACEPPSVETRKRLEESQADQIDLQMGTTSPQQIVRERGGDYEKIAAENESHQERFGQQGPTLPDDIQGGGLGESWLRETKDASGHEHGKDGKFGSGGGAPQFVRHEKSGPDEVMVHVDPKKLDAAWQKDSSYYLPTGGKGKSEVAGRREGFERFLATGKAVQAPRVSLSGDVPSFEDGRHRFAVLRDKGVASIPVMVHKDQAGDVLHKFGH